MFNSVDYAILTGKRFGFRDDCFTEKGSGVRIESINFILFSIDIDLRAEGRVAGEKYWKEAIMGDEIMVGVPAKFSIEEIEVFLSHSEVSEILVGIDDQIADRLIKKERLAILLGDDFFKMFNGSLILDEKLKRNKTAIFRHWAKF